MYMYNICGVIDICVDIIYIWDDKIDIHFLFVCDAIPDNSGDMIDTCVDNTDICDKTFHIWVEFMNHLKITNLMFIK